MKSSPNLHRPSPRPPPRRPGRCRRAPDAGPQLGRITRLWLAGLATGVGLGLAPAEAAAGPSGGEFAKGEGTIQQSGSHTQIETFTNKSIIDWAGGFDIDPGESVWIQQPTLDSFSMQRAPNASTTVIDGFLGSNGGVGIVNSAGVYIGGRAVIEVQEFLAVGGKFSKKDFKRDRYRFRKLRGEVINFGTIDAHNVTLVGSAVGNHGRIVARDGNLVMERS